MDIKYTEVCSAIGRNGQMKQTGLEILPIGNVPRKAVTLSPINTKGVGNCCLDIPIDSIPEVMKTLLDIYHEQYPIADVLAYLH